MNDTILNKIITIKSLEQAKTKTGTNTTYKLADQDGMKFIFFKLKKDGELTNVAIQFKDMGLDENSTVKIGYVKESFEFNGKNIEVNKIINIQETNEQPAKVAQTPKTAPSEPNTYKNEESPDWNNIAVGKCQTVFLEAYIASGKSIQDAMLQVVPARKLAELVVYGNTQAPIADANEEPLPEIPF